MATVRWITGLALAALLAWVPLAAAEEGGDAMLDTSIEAIVDKATRERQEAMAGREAELAAREERVKRMQADLEALIAKNEALRQELARRQEVVDRANDDKVRKLVKVYEAMTPEEAAPILNGMDERVALSLFAAMKDKAAAGIMEFMPKDKAARLGERLARSN
ncbi:MAG: hypothetical protein HZA24_02205 [Nitrospirae bacterium]|nr:hypothetical protein [Nitrospirota bacterium]